MIAAIFEERGKKRLILAILRALPPGERRVMRVTVLRADIR
jgi:hypothetical protein